MVHQNACPLCASEKTGLEFRCKDYFISGEDFPIFKCSECGFSFTQDYPEEHEITRYYESDDYISHSDSSKSFSDKLYRLTRSLMLRKKRRLIENITGLRNGAILDIGSGTGYFARTMNKAGWQVKGIEINEKARNFSISQFKLNILTPDKIPSLENESFDCITLWHVLEHFHDPLKYFSEVYRLLKPGAVCVVALPNCSSFDAKHYKKFWAAWDVPRHLWHFNPHTFSLFSQKAGLSLEKLRSLPLDVFYISMLSERYKGSMFYFIKGMTMAKWFAFLSFFNKKRSSSLVYIMRKPVE